MGMTKVEKNAGGSGVLRLPYYESPLVMAQKEFVAAYQRIEAERDVLGAPTAEAQRQLQVTFGKYFGVLMSTAGGSRRP